MSGKFALVIVALVLMGLGAAMAGGILQIAPTSGSFKLIEKVVGANAVLDSSWPVYSPYTIPTAAAQVTGVSLRMTTSNTDPSIVWLMNYKLTCGTLGRTASQGAAIIPAAIGTGGWATISGQYVSSVAAMDFCTLRVDVTAGPKGDLFRHADPAVGASGFAVVIWGEAAPPAQPPPEEPPPLPTGGGGTTPEAPIEPAPSPPGAGAEPIGNFIPGIVLFIVGVAVIGVALRR